MKVAYILGSLNRGGLEGLYLDLFRYAEHCPYEMVCVYRKNGSYLEDFKATGVKMIHLPSRGLTDVHYLRELRRLLMAEKVDVIHVQFSEDVIRTRLAMIGHQIPIVLTTHAFDYHVGKITRTIIWLSFRMTKVNIFVSDFQRKHFEKRYRIQYKQNAVVYNCVDVSKLDGNITLQEALPQVHRGIKIGMVGNFVRGRNQYALMPFLKHLHDKKVPFDFYFVGFRDVHIPERYDKCVAYCKENGLEEVHFLGGRGDVPAILKESDALVYSTEHDTFGIAVLEAIAAGVPVFVNDWDVMTEITQNGHWATIYRTGDMQDLAKKFDEFLNNKESYRNKAQADAAEVRKVYGVERFSKELLKMYEV